MSARPSSSTSRTTSRGARSQPRSRSRQSPVSSEWAGPGRALQFHLDLYESVARGVRWAQATSGQEVNHRDLPAVVRQRALLTSTQQMGVGPDRFFTDQNVSRAIMSMLHEDRMLNEGETHYVSHNVSEAVKVAAERSESQILLPTDLPAPNGLIVFETPLFFSDPAPPHNPMAVRAIGWTSTLVGQFDEDE